MRKLKLLESEVTCPRSSSGRVRILTEVGLTPEIVLFPTPSDQFKSTKKLLSTSVGTCSDIRGIAWNTDKSPVFKGSIF